MCAPGVAVPTQLLDDAGSVMTGSAAILYSDAGEVWGLTEEPYDTLNATDDDLMARCGAEQAASCPMPFSPNTCNVKCIDFVQAPKTRSALDVVSAKFNGNNCPPTRWAPKETFNSFLVEVEPFDFESHGMPPFPNGRWCILTTTPRENIYEEIDRVKESNSTVMIAAIVGAVVAVLLMAQALMSATYSGSDLNSAH